ncbi:Protein of unknown function [Pyronema omphalodes CBS 100304]|uniref:Secreted protein n=1 Tax=Pyronema omphalodes (strain CBS 100304) TaxID=1076935 RepID=U4LL66_PYROM|nr:Protein of unknown function [Pyronema omphalodes CBS 100304]
MWYVQLGFAGFLAFWLRKPLGPNERWVGSTKVTQFTASRSRSRCSLLLADFVYDVALHQSAEAKRSSQCSQSYSFSMTPLVQ